MIHHPHAHLRGGSGGHLGLRRVLIYFVAGFLGLAAIGGAISAVNGTPRPKAPCNPSQPVCVTPPSPGGLQPRLIGETEYRDPQGRFRFEYPSDLLRVMSVPGGAVVTLGPDYEQDYALTFIATDASQTPAALAQQRLSSLSDRVIGISPTTDPSQTLLGPALGFRSGVGGSYEGQMRESRTPVHVIVMASSDGHSSIVMSVAISSVDQKRIDALLHQTDHLLNSFRFTGDAPVALAGGVA